MPIQEALEIIRNFKKHGCLAVTITGGGEPLCHQYLAEMIWEFHHLGIEVGLVTNGLLLDRLSVEVLSLLTWCRISNADHRSFTPNYKQILDRAIQAPIDWAFSHVVSTDPNLEEIEAIVDYANEKNFTHVRLVADLFAVDAISFNAIKTALKGKDERVIYQPRKSYSQGSECLIGYIKPIVAPDFNMYLCCGVQYALQTPGRDLPDELCMGNARNLDEIYKAPKSFDTRKCVCCYYENYNTILRAMASDIKHAKFI